MYVLVYVFIHIGRYMITTINMARIKMVTGN